jgi:hypothetical protein
MKLIRGVKSFECHRKTRKRNSESKDGKMTDTHACTHEHWRKVTARDIALGVIKDNEVLYLTRPEPPLQPAKGGMPVISTHQNHDGSVDIVLTNGQVVTITVGGK